MLSNAYTGVITPSSCVCNAVDSFQWRKYNRKGLISIYFFMYTRALMLLLKMKMYKEKLYFFDKIKYQMHITTY